MKWQKRGRVWSLVRITLVGPISVSLFFVVMLFALFSYTYARVAEELPELDQYSATELAQTSVVYDSDGKTLWMSCTVSRIASS
jgi:membrane carboxypeptidase/penicillin-binding protein